jgi:hypothetical protein
MIRKLLPRRIKQSIREALGWERRCRFHDISQTRRTMRTPRSRVIQFYSSVDNIGNYTPVLGIQEMLGFKPDVWCAHCKPVDFDFINRHYSAAIIGGAGLLHRCFTPFYENILRECKLPMVVWGVGGCFPDADESPGVARRVFREVATRCDLINLRDKYTADFYGLHEANISLCPTVAWLEQYRHVVDRNINRVLFSSHEDLVKRTFTDEIRKLLDEQTPGWDYTDNTQNPKVGLMDILIGKYAQSSLVVTTRLHGAIFAYSLGIPYVALARDEKIRAFHAHAGNGTIAGDLSDLRAMLSCQVQTSELVPDEQAISQVKQFGAEVVDWLPSDVAV